MAKAKEIPGLDCAAGALEGAVKVLRARFDEIVGFRDAALDFSGTEGVHDIRVATRRLRSALRDFTPLMSKRPLKQITKDLKQFADTLGAVRDRDVLIAALEKLQAEAETEPVKEGVAKLVRENRGLREVMRLDLTEILDADRLKDLGRRFEAAIDKAVSGGKKTISGVSFAEAGHETITKSLDEFFDLGESIYEPFNIEALHKLRIAAKRLRYAIKLFAVCWDDKIASFAKEISAMQTSLGEVHDYDVWIGILSQRLQKNKALNESDREAAFWLLSELLNQRTKEYCAALKIWNEWKANDFAERLRTAIS